MALSAGTVWEFNAAATASNVNGGGFNTTNANFLADLTTDANTANTNSPIISSASYNFVAGDVGAWIYIKSGTNWTPGFYKIASVAANKATLTATIGTAPQFDATLNRYKANTVAGCATVGTPTAGTFGVDYSQGTTAIVNGVTDFTAVGSSTTLTSATAAFTVAMVGNLFHQTTTGTGAFGVVGWYEIVSFTNSTTVVLDRTPNSGTANVACTGYVGGAMSLNSAIDSTCIAAIIGGNFAYFKAGTFTAGQAWTGTAAAKATPSVFAGYATVRGDRPTPFGTSATAPVINMGANLYTNGTYNVWEYAQITGTASSVMTQGTTGHTIMCKVTNTSSTASRNGLSSGSFGFVIGCEFISQFGIGITTNTSTLVYGCFMHDSTTGISGGATGPGVINSIILACRTSGLSTSAPSGQFVLGNTFEGYVAVPRGTAINGSSTAQNFAISNIISGWSVGQSASALQNSTFNNYNAYYNNTTNNTNMLAGVNDVVGTNPGYVSAAELTGSTATVSGSVLTQSGGDFSTVTDNLDYLQIHSGTTSAAGCYLITSHTATTVTVNIAPGTSAVADKVWTIRTGKNLSLGTALKALGFPASFGGSTTTSYTDPGAVQRQEAGAAGGSFTFGG